VNLVFPEDHFRVFYSFT